jgi:hypothetical protein
MPDDNNPHTLRAYADGIDLIPYVAVLAVPFAWAFWALGVPGGSSPEAIEDSWWFKGYLAVLFYVPSMAICGVVEWECRRRNWSRVRACVRLFRWAHFLVVMGPIIVLMAAIFIPPVGRLIS